MDSLFHDLCHIELSLALGELWPILHQILSLIFLQSKSRQFPQFVNGHLILAQRFVLVFVAARRVADPKCCRVSFVVLEAAHGLEQGGRLGHPALTNFKVSDLVKRAENILGILEHPLRDDARLDELALWVGPALEEWARDDLQLVAVPGQPPARVLKGGPQILVVVGVLGQDVGQRESVPHHGLVVRVVAGSRHVPPVDAQQVVVPVVVRQPAPQPRLQQRLLVEVHAHPARIPRLALHPLEHRQWDLLLPAEKNREAGVLNFDDWPQLVCYSGPLLYWLGFGLGCGWGLGLGLCRGLGRLKAAGLLWEKVS